MCALIKCCFGRKDIKDKTYCDWFFEGRAGEAKLREGTQITQVCFLLFSQDPFQTPFAFLSFVWLTSSSPSTLLFHALCLALSFLFTHSHLHTYVFRLTHTYTPTQREREREGATHSLLHPCLLSLSFILFALSLLPLSLSHLDSHTSTHARTHAQFHYRSKTVPEEGGYFQNEEAYPLQSVLAFFQL